LNKLTKVTLGALLGLGLMGASASASETDTSVNPSVNPIVKRIGAKASGSAMLATDVLWRGVSSTAEGVGTEIDLVLDFDTDIGTFYGGADVAGSVSNASIIYKAGYSNTWGEDFPVLTVIEYNINDFQNTAAKGGQDLTDSNFENVLATVGVTVFDIDVWGTGEFVTNENDTADYNTEDRYGVGADYVVQTLAGDIILAGSFFDQDKWGQNWAVGASNPITKNLILGVSYNDFDIDNDTQSGLTKDTETVVGTLTYLF